MINFGNMQCFICVGECEGCGLSADDLAPGEHEDVGGREETAAEDRAGEDEDGRKHEDRHLWWRSKPER